MKPSSSIGRDKPHGIFVNVPRANCSIYESGRMVYDCLVLSDRYVLEYIEIDAYARDLPNSFDFYAFNYHHVRMSWLETRSIQKLPGLRLTFVLETLPNNPFVLCPSEDFDVYCALDPTMDVADKRVYAFPRPLETVSFQPPEREPAIPIIGTFGFATRGKGFELVVDAVNQEFDKAIVRINLPPSPFAHKPRSFFPRKDFAERLSDLCKKSAKKGIEVIITRDYLTKPELIRWCAENTLNCFLYDRNQPGLSATTDQAIVSGRPLAVSSNQTFRHIHPYITPYPAQNLRDAIRTSPGQVKKMQEDWSPKKFAARFEQVLGDAGVLAGGHKGQPAPEIIHLQAKQPPVTFPARCRRMIHKAGIALEDVLETIHPSPRRKTLCKFLHSRSEVRACTAYLNSHGYISHRLTCKDWDLANILGDLSEGDLLDAGSSDSYLLRNAVRKGLQGKKYGIDLQRPDVPVEGVTYVVGDLTHTGFADGEFQNITCLSVIEHELDFNAFAREVSRLLKPGGRLYVSFDYWTPKIVPRLRLFGVAWNILDQKDAQRLIDECDAQHLTVADPIDWSLKKPVINAGYYSPDHQIGYTFGLLVFQKV